MSSEQRESPHGRILRIDCGTAETAELIRQIDAHGQLGVVLDTDVANPDTERKVRGPRHVEQRSRPGGTWVEMQQPPGEPLDQLIQRLGSRPPAVLLDAWSHQLHQLKERLQSVRLPLHRAGIEDLRVDGAARLHVANLPLRIAESVCHAEPECPDTGSLGPWLRRDQPLDLGGFDALEAALQDLSGPASERVDAAGIASPSVAVAALSARSANATSTDAVVAARAREHGPRTPRRPDWRWLAVPAAGAAIAVAALRGSGDGQPDASKRRTEPPASSAAAAPAAMNSEAMGSAAGAGNRSRSEPPAPALELSRALPAASAAESSDTPPLENVDLFAGPPVDLAAIGLEAPAPAVISPQSNRITTEPHRGGPEGDGPDGGAPLEGGPARDPPVEPGPGAEASPPLHGSVDLPPRGDLRPMTLTALNGISADRLVAAELELPPGSEAWQWTLAEAATEPRLGTSGDERVHLIGEDASGDQRVVAVLQSSTETASQNSGPAGAELLWSWTWTAEAAAAAPAEHLRNARLRLGSRVIYLREPIEVPAVRLALDQPQQSEEWALAAAPALRASHLTLAATTVEAGPDAAEPLRIYWLQKIEQAAERSVKGIVELRTAEDSPVAVRVRFDLEAGRNVRMASMAVATLAPLAAWHPISQAEVSAVLDRVLNKQQEVAGQLQLLEQQYARIEDREARSLMRTQRRNLEDQQEVWAQQVARIGELQLLVSRIATEIRWRIEVQTEWPDDIQPLFAARPAGL